MFPVFHKWFILTCIILCCSSSFGKDEGGPNLVLAIQKINEDELNLTCLAKGKRKFEGLSLTGPEEDQSTGETTVKNRQMNDDLNDTIDLVVDLPPVLDQQWEEFPIQGPNDQFTLRANESLWISIRYKQDLAIHYKNDIKYLNVVCKENHRWVLLQLCLNSTHLSIKSDMCSTESTLNMKSIEGYFTINSTYKLHRYKVLTITEQEIPDISNTNLKMLDIRKKVIKIHSDADYIRSYYYLTCTSCNGTIMLENSNGQKINISNLSVSTNNEWSSIDLEVNISSDSESQNSIIDVVFTLQFKMNSSVTLVVRNIIIRQRFAGHSISKIIKLTDLSHYICESMESKLFIKDGIIKPTNETKLVSQFLQSKLCYSNGTCYCSAGSQGEMCEKSCDDGYYGNCLTECDCCSTENICNKETGSCIEYETNNCKESRSVKNITLQSFPTSITGNVVLEKHALQQRINSIKIEYKTIDDNSWTRLNYEENLDNPNINITELKPNTNYNVSASLCGKSKCFDEYKYFVNITTTCHEPISSDLELDIKQTEVSLNISSTYALKNGACPKLVSMSYNNQAEKNSIIGLTAFMNYTINILFKGKVIEKRSILTKKTQSGVVSNLSFNETNSLISWKKPKYPNGNLGQYFVNITRLGSIICKKEPPENLQKETADLDLPITVFPYSEYKVIVEASNEEGRGHAENKIFHTLSKNEIDNNEEPIKFGINETHLQIEILGCDKVYGPWIIYESTFTFTCFNSSCANEQSVSSVNVSYTQEKKYIMPLNISLEPYTNYKVQTSIYRNKASSIKLINSTNMVTLPKCPPPVRNFDVYSVNDNSISVRWKLPDPPRGVLERIIFKFYNASGANNNASETKKVLKKEHMKKCVLWDDTDYFCKTYDNIDETSFPIYVIAKNMNTDRCNENATINKMVLPETASEAPIDLTATWNGDMEELELTWKHPNKTNRQLKHFNIILKSLTKESDIINIVFEISSESHYYNYTVKDFTKSSKYIVEVIPVNEVSGKAAKLEKEIITPPPYPVINSKSTFFIDGNNCSVHFPSIRNTTINSSMMVILWKGDCNSAFGYNKTLGQEAVNLKKDVFNETVIVDLKNEFKIANISDYNDYSITIVVVNEFEGIFRNKSICLAKTTNVVNISSSLYLWTGLIILILLLVIFAGLIIHKYWPIKCINIFRNINQNITLPPRRNSTIDNAQIELMLLTRNNKVSYENQPLIPKSNAIQRRKLFKYLKSAVKYGDECALYTEFDSIPLKLSDFSETSLKNKIKNRYLNILPYEENRVTLKSGKYINASFIQGYKTEKAYIATQGPKLQTVDDFWEMVFEHNVKLIAMLCPIKEGGNIKCDQYWPDFRNKILNSRNLEIEFGVEKNCGVYIERHFTIKCDGAKNKIVQLQLIAWMDHRVPSSSQFLHELLERFHNLHDYCSPAVVHCSAGAGRTGTFILCDHLLKMEADTSTLDFPLVLCNLRKERTQMVQTKEQYHFAHVVIYEYLCVGKNRVACDENFEKNVLKIIESKDIIAQELLLLDNLSAIDVSTFNQKNVTMEPEDVAKNRDQTILPTSSGIIYLQASKLTSSMYINAINVDGYNHSEKFIVTQQPLISSHGSTLADYWRLVFQTKPEVIISLQSQLVNFYPIEKVLLINKYIKLKCVKQQQSLLSTTFTIKIEIDNKDYTVKIIQANTKLEATNEGMLELINFYGEYRNNYSHKESAVLVTCLNGCELSGFFVALDYTIEKILQQEICDVFLAVRTVRRTRPNFITSEQYRLLYQCALEIRKSMCMVYSNVS